MLNYAQIDGNNIVIGVSQLTSEVDALNVIPIKEYDTTLLGKLYEAGKFIDMNYYAELNQNSMVTNILSNPSNKAMPSNWGNTVPIKQQDYSLIGTRYINGEFLRVDRQKQLMEELLQAINRLTNKVESLESKLNNH